MNICSGCLYLFSTSTSVDINEGPGDRPLDYAGITTQLFLKSTPVVLSTTRQNRERLDPQRINTRVQSVREKIFPNNKPSVRQVGD